jgi:tRNA 2-thiouridine synthesizing protein B
MTLHTINKTSALALCEPHLSPGDGIVLLEDGVYLALALGRPAAAVRADAEARGLVGRLPADITLISYDEFVTLTCEADKICSWF